MMHVDDHDLDGELTAAFRVAAARAPLSTPLWHGPVSDPVESGHPVRHLAAATAAVGLVAGGVIAVTMTLDAPRRDVRSVVSAPVVAPPTEPSPPRGAELPFVPVEARPEFAATFEPLGLEPIRPGSLVAATYDGYPVVFYTTLTATAPGVVEMRCGAIAPDGNGFCTPVNETGANYGLVEGAGGSVWFWLGVPARTNYVRASVGGESFWERPVGNAAVFPASDDRDESFAPWPVLGDAGGSTDSSLPTPAEMASSTLGHPLQPAIRDDAESAVWRAAQACLDDAGLGDPFEVPDPAIDVDIVWNRCVLEAVKALDAVLDDASANPSAGLPNTTVCPDGGPQATYTIAEGDTHLSVAEMLDVTIDDLEQANAGWPNYRPFIPGAEILVPC